MCENFSGGYFFYLAQFWILGPGEGLKVGPRPFFDILAITLGFSFGAKLGFLVMFFVFLTCLRTSPGVIFFIWPNLDFWALGRGPKWPKMAKFLRFSDLAKTLHPDRFLGVEFENEVHFQKFWKFDPQNGQKGAKKAKFWSFSDLAKILHPGRFLDVEFENEVHFR